MAPTIEHLTTKAQIERLGLTGFEDAGGIIRMRNGNGMEVLVTPFGASTLRVIVPDRHGRPTNVALGFNSLAEYVRDTSYQGRVIGRNANRIANARYTDPVTGEVIELDANDKNTGANLHGGRRGWSERTWNIHPNERMVQNQGSVSTTFFINDNNQEEGAGFPGLVYGGAKVTLSEDNVLSYPLHVSLFQMGSIANPTIHTYFNLNGASSGTTVHNHLMQTNANAHVVVRNLIPTGALENVVGTRFDFTKERSIGGEHFGKTGYDDCWALTEGGQIYVRVFSPKTEIQMTATADPETRAFQGYTSYFLNGKPAIQFGGICIEPGDAIDAINQPELCQALGITPFKEAFSDFHRTISYKFDVRR